MSDKKLNLTRRKALLGLGGMGAAAAIGGAGTMAFLEDPEHIQNNALTAGNLDLTLDWAWVYHGRQKETDYQLPANDDNIGPMIELGDVKPGDYGCGVISIHIEDNPAYVWLRTNNVESAENGQNEPEKETEGDDQDGMGELGEAIRLVTAPLGCYPKDDCPETRTVANNNTQSQIDLSNWTETDNPQWTQSSGASGECYCKGSLQDTLDALDGGINLGEKGAGKICFIGFCWCLPKEVGNEIQGDSISFDLDFFAQQSRHNSGNTNPWNN